MKIGYQLYSARDLCGDAAGLRNTIAALAKMGYQGVEFYDYAGIPAGDLRRFLADLGVEAVNAHVQLEKWRSSLDAELAYAAEAGIPMITIPWIAPEERTPAGYAAIASALAGWAAKAKAAGVKIGYHNHDFEYEALEGGKNALDILGAGSEALLFELDTFWVMHAGVGPVEEMTKWRGRLGPVHIKDYTDRTSTPPVFCAIGRGSMNNAPIIAKTKELNLAWLVVEQDNCVGDPLESAAASIAAL